MKHSSVALSLMMAVLVASLSTAPAAHATDCVVVNTSDSALGTPTVPGSLRDCMERARSGDTITFDADVFDLTNSNAATVITLIDSALPYLDDGNVTIEASDRRVSVNGSGASSANGLTISSSGNVIRGLTILGFPRVGIQIADGTGNVIGGDRSVGGGPNGQGLRISANGSFGIEILGSGASSNIVKGCWIGLDSGGTAAEANLAGVVIQGGAATNTIGSVVPGEANVISGNSLEGITVAGTGTDNNVVIGNTVGASTHLLSARREVPNGGPGVAITDGAEGTQVGGEDPGEGNDISFNGGNGVEVRSPTTKRNSVKGNRITKNTGGGIKLFDGSNNDVKAPAIQKIVAAPPSGAGPQLVVSGTTIAAGTVEVFSDTGSQGETFLGRGTYATATTFNLEIDGVIQGGFHSMTATFTDANGNTSPFGIFGVTRGEDTDDDGVPDDIEVAAGTSPSDPLSTPTLAGPLTASKLGIKLNFAKASSDAIDLKATVTLPPGFPLAGVRVAVWISRHGNQLILDDKGKAKSSDGLVSIALKTSSKTGLTTVQYKVKKSALQADVGPLGLDDRTTPTTGVALLTPFTMTTSSAVGASLYHGVSVQTYKAKQGKTGKASNAK